MDLITATQLLGIDETRAWFQIYAIATVSGYRVDLGS